MSKQPIVVESQRSEELWSELREQGFIQRFDVRENLTRVTYWNNERGKAILVLEHGCRDQKGGAYQWNSWDIYTRLCEENNIAKTYAALKEWAPQEVGA